MDPLVLGERRIGGTSQRKKSRFSRLGRSLIQSFCSVIIKKAGSVYHYLKEKNKWGELNNKPREVFLKKYGKPRVYQFLKYLCQTFPVVTQKLGKFSVLKPSLFLLLF